MGMLLTRHYKDKNKAEGATPKVEVAPKPVPAKKENEYTEEKIKKMSGPQLRKLAVKNGIESPEELTAGELKSILCGLLVK